MPVAPATAQAQADARGEAKAFAKENAGGFQPSSNGLTTLMLALFAIMTDITDDFVPALLLLNHVTTQIPLASILRNARYLDIEMGAFHAGGGGAQAGGGGHQQVLAAYNDPLFGADNQHTWSTITAQVGNLTSYLILATKLLHRILGFQGMFFDEINHLNPDAFLDAIKTLTTAFFTVNPQSVTKLWSKFNSASYEFGSGQGGFLYQGGIHVPWRQCLAQVGV